MPTNHTPRAYMGFSAAVSMEAYAITGSLPSNLAAPFRLRASSVGLQVKQDITMPPLIDGIVDMSAYQLGASIVEGDIAFPLIHEGVALPGDSNKSTGCGTTYQGSLAGNLWQIAATRDNTGRLQYAVNNNVCYPDNSVWVYPYCLVNNMKWTVNQGAPIEVTCGYVGGGYGTTRIALGDTTTTASNGNTGYAGNGGTFAVDGSLVPDYLSPARIITWNDFSMAIWGRNSPGFTGGITQVLSDGKGIRSFDVEIKNNVDRYYTLNGLLAPQDIAAKKREITGTFKILGRSQWLNYIGETNQNRFSSDEELAFGYKVGSSGNFYWATSLTGLIFKLEELTINPSDVFESTVGYMAMGDCSFSYEAIGIGVSLSQSTLPQPTSSAIYGRSTADRTDSTDGSSPFLGWGSY